MQTVNYKQMAMVLLAATESLNAALTHQGVECNDITFVLTDDEGRATEVTTTIETLISSAKYALGQAPSHITTSEQEV